MKTRHDLILIVLVLAVGCVLVLNFGSIGDKNKPSLPPSLQITSFEECVEAGNQVMESYPRKCRNNNEIFVENIGNVVEKSDLIRVFEPLPNSVLSQPLVIRGEARGVWFFEANFPIMLTNWDGLIIGEGYATAEGEWMTEEFVPFTAIIEFIKPDLYNRGSLILQKSNPSDLRELDDALEYQIKFW